MAVLLWVGSFMVIVLTKMLSDCSAFGGRCDASSGGFDFEVFRLLLVPMLVAAAGVLIVIDAKRRTARFVVIVALAATGCAAILSFG